LKRFPAIRPQPLYGLKTSPICRQFIKSTSPTEASIALYDDEQHRPDLEYADGRRVYEID
jgi:hypothetical protein